MKLRISYTEVDPGWSSHREKDQQCRRSASSVLDGSSHARLMISCISSTSNAFASEGIARENLFASSIVIDSPRSSSQSTGLLNQPSLACTSFTCSPGGTSTSPEKKARPMRLLIVMGCRQSKPCGSGPPSVHGTCSEWPVLRYGPRSTGAAIHFHRTCPGGTTDPSDTTDKAPGYV